jgi:hypothetical protein
VSGLIFFMYKLSTIWYKNVRVVRDLGVSVDLLDSLYSLQIAVHVLPIFPFFFFFFLLSFGLFSAETKIGCMHMIFFTFSALGPYGLFTLSAVGPCAWF